MIFDDEGGGGGLDPPLKKMTSFLNGPLMLSLLESFDIFVVVLPLFVWSHHSRISPELW